MIPLYGATLHGAEDDTFVYLIKAVYALVKTRDKNSEFHAPTFYKYETNLLRELCVLKNISLQLRINHSERSWKARQTFPRGPQSVIPSR